MNNCYAMRFLSSFNKQSKSKTEWIRSSRRDCVERIKGSHRRMMENSNTIDDGAWMYDLQINDAALSAICDRSDDFSDPIEYAAFIIDYVNAFHPFVDGNKRMSLLLAVQALGSEGYKLDNSPEVAQFIKDVASGLYDRAEIEAWLRSYLTRRACGKRPGALP